MNLWDKINRKGNLPLLVLFVLSSAFMIYQHKINLSWDFSSYVLGAKYLFYNGSYFESYRPIVPEILLGFFLLVGVAGEYLYIIFSSALFLFANVVLADSVFSESKINKDIKRAIFYFFSLSAFFLAYATFAGSEMLALAFFELFLCYLIRGKISGHFLALAFLTRYSFILFAPLMLFNKSFKIVIKNLGLFLLVSLPWLLFNYFKFGNLFASVIDSYAMNVLYRGHLIEPFNFSAVLQAISWFWPFLILGFVMAGLSLYRHKWKEKNNLINLLFLVLVLLILFDFSGIPIKLDRYLFNLSLPVAFFSSLGVFFILERTKLNSRKIISCLVGLFLITLVFSVVFEYRTNNYDTMFYGAAREIEKRGLSNCEILSPHWVPMHYLTGNVYPLGDKGVLESLRSGKIILVFKNVSTVDDAITSTQYPDYPIMHESGQYLFFGKEGLNNDTCAKKYVSDESYIRNHCEVLSAKFGVINGFVLRVCNIANFNL